LVLKKEGKKKKNPNALFHPLDLVFWDLVLMWRRTNRKEKEKEKKKK
jgi:hypothetical protein